MLCFQQVKFILFQLSMQNCELFVPESDLTYLFMYMVIIFSLDLEHWWWNVTTVHLRG